MKILHHTIRMLDPNSVQITVAIENDGKLYNQIVCVSSKLELGIALRISLMDAIQLLAKSLAEDYLKGL